MAVEPLQRGEHRGLGVGATSFAAQGALAAAVAEDSGSAGADADRVVDTLGVLVDVRQLVEVGALRDVGGHLVDLRLDHRILDDLGIEDPGDVLEVAFLLRVVGGWRLLLAHHHRLVARLLALLLLGDDDPADPQDQHDVQDGGGGPPGHLPRPGGVYDGPVRALAIVGVDGRGMIRRIGGATHEDLRCIGFESGDRGTSRSPRERDFRSPGGVAFLHGLRTSAPTTGAVDVLESSGARGRVAELRARRAVTGPA